jgi:hypothetical protein
VLSGTFLFVIALAVIIGGQYAVENVSGTMQTWSIIAVNGAGDLHSGPGGYSVSVPAGWTQIPDAQLQPLINQVQNAAGAKWRYEIGLEPKAQSWRTTPFVLIGVQPYPAGAAQPTDADATDFVANFISDARPEVQNASSPALDALVSKGLFIEPYYNTQQNAISGILQRHPFGAAESIGQIHLGHRAAVLILSVDILEHMHYSAEAVEDINDSFKFDPDAVFQ